MDPHFFESQGVVFADDYMVGFSNGHAVLDAGWTQPPTTIAGSFTSPVTSITASIRMGMQGTSAYTIVAYSKTGTPVGSGTITLTQNGLDGNFYEVTANALSPGATSFSIDGAIAYGVKSITYSTAAGDQTPYVVAEVPVASYGGLRVITTEVTPQLCFNCIFQPGTPRISFGPISNASQGTTIWIDATTPGFADVAARLTDGVDEQLDQLFYVGPVETGTHSYRV